MGAEAKRLEQRRDEILQEIKELRKYLTYEPEHKDDESDTDSYERETHLTLIRTLERKLAEINEALDNMKEGTYGICERCRKPINPERLAVLPEASLCVQCKTLVEQMNRTGIRTPGW